MKGVELLPGDGRAVLFEGIIPSDLYATLREELDWRKESIHLFGRRRPVPRLVAYYGDLPYRYAGVEHAARPLPEPLPDLKALVERTAGHAFRSVLCNFYRNGRDSMGYHRDNEPEIDPACIASVSFGATRRFRMRHRTNRQTVSVDLTDRSLLLMFDCQDLWEHAVPKTRRPVGGRINLTFRMMRASR